MLAGQLDSRDRISMVVYAGASGVVLPATPGNRKADIMAALQQLHAGGLNQWSRRYTACLSVGAAKLYSERK